VWPRGRVAVWMQTTPTCARCVRARFQAGQTSDAILALEDEVFKMVGSAELHAALAALLYTERPGLGFRAEEVSGGGRGGGAAPPARCICGGTP
jgi:hypothetical protein